MLSHPNLPFLLFLLFILQSLAAMTKRCNVDDENGLLAFKSGIKSDPSGMLNSWKPGTDCCTWSGIYCRPESSNRVTNLYIDGGASEGKNMNILSGPISPSLSKLQYLESLFFGDLGNLTGPFPDFVFAIPNISSILITNSKLSGCIPRNIGNLTTLETLVLSGNQFSGRIPSLAKLTRLIELDLSYNRLSGVIPYGFQRLKYLFRLNLSWNQLNGTIPDIFSPFSFLKLVHLSNNNFSGKIPKSLSNLESIVIDLGHNALTGQIPDFPDRFNSMKELNLSWNQLSGIVPTSFGNFIEISILDVSHNKLHGSFPEMRFAYNMHTLDLSYNDYHFQSIPKWIGNTSMNTLKLVKCGIKIKLSDWKPTAFFANIDLSENELTGSPLPLLKTKTELEGLWASGNKLKFVMRHLKIGKNLKYLDLSKNLVFGNVPKTVSRLQELNVSHNHLCGPLPATKFPASAFLGNDCLCGTPLPACKA